MDMNDICFKFKDVDEYLYIKELLLQNGYKKAFGKEPSIETLGIGWAQGSLESGRPTRLPCNNVGNIKATSDWLKSGKKYFVIDTKEIDKNGKEYTSVSWYVSFFLYLAWFNTHQSIFGESRK